MVRENWTEKLDETLSRLNTLNDPSFEYPLNSIAIGYRKGLLLVASAVFLLYVLDSGEAIVPGIGFNLLKLSGPSRDAVSIVLLLYFHLNYLVESYYSYRYWQLNNQRHSSEEARLRYALNESIAKPNTNASKYEVEMRNKMQPIYEKLAARKRRLSQFRLCIAIIFPFLYGIASFYFPIASLVR